MKPYVICHMVSSVDGRILPDRWHPPFQAHGLYERLQTSWGATPGWWAG
jgi:riboflavin biosynthesis pyrimidine reductase